MKKKIIFFLFSLVFCTCMVIEVDIFKANSFLGAIRVVSYFHVNL